MTEDTGQRTDLHTEIDRRKRELLDWEPGFPRYRTASITCSEMSKLA